METNKRKSKPIMPYILLSLGIILAVTAIIFNFMAISDFTKGFVSGISIICLVLGLIMRAAGSLKSNK